MINKCKVQIGIIELYNVIESHNEKRGKNGIHHSRNRTFCGVSILVFFIPATTLFIPEADQISLRLSSFTHPLRIIIVRCALGQGLIKRVWARKIVQLQLAPSVGRTTASTSTTVEVWQN